MEKGDLLTVSRDDLGTKYPEIGRGSEGCIFNYNDKYAIKTFTLYHGLPEIYANRLKRKIAKLQLMMNVSEEQCTLPYGFISYGDRIEGYYTRLVNGKKGRKDFTYLEELQNKRKVIEYLIKADAVLKRLHEKKFIVGDVKTDNIMIDKNGEPVFVDVDNYMFGPYGFDLIPDRAGCFYTCYGNTTSYKDNDIFVYTLMALNILTGLDQFGCFATKEDIQDGLSKLCVTREVRNDLQQILSDSLDKPYVGPVLKKMQNGGIKL